MNDNSPVLPRRTAVAGTVAVCGLASACARYGGPTTPQPDTIAGDDTGGGGATGDVLGLATDVPVGGGTVFRDREIVVTQPSEGVFRGFSALCTHQGCVVTGVADGTINCDCHNSKFGVGDGAVLAGPAPEPLAAQQVSVTADGKLVTGGAPPDTTAQTTEPPAETTEQTTEPAAPPLASTSDIPVGGGTVFADQEIVITQPTRGDIRCFSAVCTHQGCLVSTVAGGTINCDCHGSKFAIADGSVTAGPAPEPLGEREILVDDGRISLP